MICGFNVHHLDYRRVGCELVGDLAVVCLECHELLEDAVNRLSPRFGRRRVMDRLRPYAHRRLLKWHRLLAPRWQPSISESWENVREKLSR